jgi:hypothetical protein
MILLLLEACRRKMEKEDLEDYLLVDLSKLLLMRYQIMKLMANISSKSKNFSMIFFAQMQRNNRLQIELYNRNRSIQKIETQKQD